MGGGGQPPVDPTLKLMHSTIRWLLIWSLDRMPHLHATLYVPSISNFWIASLPLSLGCFGHCTLTYRLTWPESTKYWFETHGMTFHPFRMKNKNENKSRQMPTKWGRKHLNVYYLILFQIEHIKITTRNYSIFTWLATILYSPGAVAESWPLQ